MNEPLRCPKYTDMNSFVYSLDEHLPEFQRTDLDTVILVSLIGEITIGVGLGSLLLASIFRSMNSKTLAFAGNNTYAGGLEFFASLGGMVAATLGLLSFIDYLNYQTAYNALRAWKRNFLVYCVVVAVTILPL